jgi:hypothetical protein
MLLTILFIIVPLFGILAFLFIGGKDTNGYSWLQFYARGKEAGFAWSEITLLRQVAMKVELAEPVALFWSVKQLDLCIRNLIKKARLTGEEGSPETQAFLNKLYEYRKKIEFENPRVKKGIRSSRAVSSGQRVRLLVEKIGVFASVVQRNSDRYLTIARPVDGRLPSDFIWKGRRIAVYFWRRDDAGYVFDTYVLDSVDEKNSPSLQLAHSDSLFRTQKRRSIRTKTRLSAYLYIPKLGDPSEAVETEPGLRCIVEDLSEDGLAVIIGGKAASGLLVKIQFELNGEPIAITGVVRSTEYSAEPNRSLLHIEAERLSVPTRNRILAEVFGVQPEGELGAGFSSFDAAAAVPAAVRVPTVDGIGAEDEATDGLESPDSLVAGMADGSSAVGRGPVPHSGGKP